MSKPTENGESTEQSTEQPKESTEITEHAATEIESDKSDKPMDYPQWLSTFQHWLGGTGVNERKNLTEFFDRSKQWWNTAAELSKDEFAQASTYFKRDLMMFYRHYQQDLEQSDYVQSVKESMWRELAELTDKSQIEWQELKKDFDHEGVYRAGEWIGMGIIVCKSCHYRMEFVHPETLSTCPQCNGSTFLREALAP